jgi:hypothetical protein
MNSHQDIGGEMRRLPLALFAIVAFCSTMAAQDSSRFKVFGGYSFERIAPCGTAEGQYPCNAESGFLAPATNFNGWNAACTTYFTRHFGVTADFSGHYGPYRFANAESDFPTASRYSYMFGPTFA